LWATHPFRSDAAAGMFMSAVVVHTNGTAFAFDVVTAVAEILGVAGGPVTCAGAVVVAPVAPGAGSSQPSSPGFAVATVAGYLVPRYRKAGQGGEERKGAP
jgi:hypothetical protein